MIIVILCAAIRLIPLLYEKVSNHNCAYHRTETSLAGCSLRSKL